MTSHLKTSLHIVILSLLSTSVFGQKDFNNFAEFYPIGEDPNIRWMSSYTPQERILFEANPHVRYSIFNNFVNGLMGREKHTQSWHISFKPQLRMYNDNSSPVRTPSYRIFLGTQHMFRLENTTKGAAQFLAFSLETGHYSNGQDGSAFSELFPDGSVQGDSMYQHITADTDLSKILNRKSGNFSTNLTEIILNYRVYQLDDDWLPLKSHSAELGYTLYHDRFLGFADFGGYSDQDIKIYGHHRLHMSYEYMTHLKSFKDKRFTFRQSVDVIADAHKSVQPLRLESKMTIYPLQITPALGINISYIYGHDNYNYRFVDAGHQLAIGLSWNQFPKTPMNNDL